ncbi:MAG: hypothetical protein WA634_17340 [Silvibacterium sp.]
MTDASGSRRWYIALAALFLFALLARIPFYATHHIQEDAFITFRSAYHLADFGKYSFNLGERSSGVTSTIYGPYIAGIRLLFHAHTIAAVSVFNTLIFLAGAAALSLSFFTDWRKRLLFFAAIAMLPEGLLITYADMEIPFQVAAFCAAIFTLRHGRPSWKTLVCVLFLPLVRPDAIAYSLILTVLAFSFDRLYGVLALVCSLAGEALVLVFNRLLTGNFITATMRAKEIAFQPGHSLHTILSTANVVLIHISYLLPVESKFLQWSGPVVTVLVLGGCLAALWLARRQMVLFRLLLASFAAGVLIPGAYILGGVIFPWYLWTSNWLCYALICFAVIWVLFAIKPRARVALIVLFTVVWVALDSAQWLVSCNIGLQEYHYRADVGRWLHQVAQPGDTLALEPAGYIPFYAGLKTYDEIGLVSTLVIDYRVRYGGAWWMDFLKQEHPTWLVERNYVVRHVTIDNVHLSPADSLWFDTHYKLVRHFHYSAANYLHRGLLLRIMKNGTHDDYYVYHYTGTP